MAYSEVPNANLAVDKPIRSADIIQMYDNITNHESRIGAIEDPLYLLDHFAEDHGYPSGVIINEATAQNTKPDTLDPNGAASVVKHPYANPRIILYVDSSNSWTEAISGSTSDRHSIVCSGKGALRCTPSIYFDNRTAPITFTTRIKITTNPVAATSMFLGFSDGDSIFGARPSNGIYAEFSSGTNWRFTTSRAGSNTAGTVFTNPTAATWFTLQIVMNDDAGTHVECYIDGDLKEDATLTLPTDKPIWPFLSFNSAAAWEVDYVSLASGGIDDAA